MQQVPPGEGDRVWCGGTPLQLAVLPPHARPAVWECRWLLAGACCTCRRPHEILSIASFILLRPYPSRLGTAQDTDAAGTVPPRQAVTLQYQLDATVATGDEPPVVLGK